MWEKSFKIRYLSKCSKCSLKSGKKDAAKLNFKFLTPDPDQEHPDSAPSTNMQTDPYGFVPLFATLIKPLTKLFSKMSRCIPFR
jgi:hypothetical protein